MVGFDESRLDDRLDAEDRAETELSSVRRWANRKYEQIRCVLMGSKK
jgi:hypothetical protein